MYAHIIPREWSNWFILIKNRHNGLLFPIEISDETTTYFTKDRQNWKIYISCHLKNGLVFKTSSIVSFNEDTNEVITENGSTYKLMEAINKSQLVNLKNYFANDEFPSFDAFK